MYSVCMCVKCNIQFTENVSESIVYQKISSLNKIHIHDINCTDYICGSCGGVCWDCNIWGVRPHSLVDGNWCFGGNGCLPVQGLLSWRWKQCFLYQRTRYLMPEVNNLDVHCHATVRSIFGMIFVVFDLLCKDNIRNHFL